MKTQGKRKGKLSKRQRELRARVKAFLALCLLAVLVLSVFLGGKNLLQESQGEVHAEEIKLTTADGMDRLPTGMAGVMSSVGKVPAPGAKIKRIGTSCEDMIVGQRVSTVRDSKVSVNVSSSMENTVNRLEQQSSSIAANAKMMSDEDYNWLLRIVEAEAGEGDVKSRVLVANVIMNRVRRDDFPNTVVDVVFQYVNGVPQFSPTYDGRIYSVTVTAETKEAVKMALEGTDYSQGALFFIQKEAAESGNVTWFETELKYLFKYGVHEYYTYPEK